MARKHAQFLIVAILLSTSLFARDALSTQDVLKRILDKAKQNEQLAGNVGFSQATRIKKMNDGKITSEDFRQYRLTWINNRPYMELLKINGKDLDAVAKKEEKERKAKFIKSLTKKREDDDEDITLDDLYVKYDFQLLPADSVAQYVFSFKPKEGKLPDRSRTERVLNHVTGKFWADGEFNIVRAEGDLIDDVRFGLGILGKLENLQIKYQQQSYDQVHVPSSLFIHFKARIALLKTDERQIEATYTDYFRRPDPAAGRNE